MCLAIPAQVVELSDQPIATVEVSGVRRKVNVQLVQQDGLKQGDWVLIHVGFAMSLISEKEAREQIELLERMGEVQEAQAEIEGYRFGK